MQVARSRRSLNLLEPLVNLRSITINKYEGECLCTHDKVNLPKLKKLLLIDMHIKCSKCLTAIASSFPNLNVFCGSINSQNYAEILEIMFTNWRYLEIMNITSGRKWENFGKLIENLMEQRTHLRTLEIRLDTTLKCSGDNFLRMSKIFPDLTSLSIGPIEYSVNIEDLVKGILPAFKKLTTLCINGGYVHTNKGILEHLELYGQSLRVSQLVITRKFIT